MIGPRPILPARGLIALTVVILPMDARDRYREELHTELCELGGATQLGQAIGILVCAVQLRRALNARDVAVTVAARKDWRCRIRRHSYVWRRDDNPEMYGRPYHECLRCGERFEPDDEEKIDIESYARNNTPFQSGGTM